MFKTIEENDTPWMCKYALQHSAVEENASGWNSHGFVIHNPVECYYTSTSKKCDAFQGNPASLSLLVNSVFPPGVVGAELRIVADPSLLFPYEAQYLARAVPERIQEFTAGRLCARRAMAEFGFTDRPLHMHSDRRPQWPQPIIGSISHTSGMCGAVVAKKRQFRAIGLDMEIVGNVTAEIWPTICSPEEIAWLATLPEPEQARCAAIIFSAKESFYKCQYNVTQQWLEYDDVTLNLSFSDVSAGYFALRPLRRIALLEYAAMPLLGRFKLHGNIVVTGMVIEAR